MDRPLGRGGEGSPTTSDLAHAGPGAPEKPRSLPPGLRTFGSPAADLELGAGPDFAQDLGVTVVAQDGTPLVGIGVLVRLEAVTGEILIEAWQPSRTAGLALFPDLAAHVRTVPTAARLRVFFERDDSAELVFPIERLPARALTLVRTFETDRAEIAKAHPQATPPGPAAAGVVEASSELAAALGVLVQYDPVGGSGSVPERTALDVEAFGSALGAATLGDLASDPLGQLASALEAALHTSPAAPESSGAPRDVPASVLDATRELGFDAALAADLVASVLGDTWWGTSRRKGALEAMVVDRGTSSGSRGGRETSPGETLVSPGETFALQGGPTGAGTRALAESEASVETAETAATGESAATPEAPATSGTTATAASTETAATAETAETAGTSDSFASGATGDNNEGSLGPRVPGDAQQAAPKARPVPVASVAGRVTVDVAPRELFVELDEVLPLDPTRAGRRLGPFVPDETGAFRFEGVQPGLCAVRVGLFGSRRTLVWVENLEVGPGARFTNDALQSIDLTGRLGSIAVELFDPHGRRIESAVVQPLDVGTGIVGRLSVQGPGATPRVYFDREAVGVPGQGGGIDVRLEAPGFAPRDARITAAEVEVGQPVAFRLEPEHPSQLELRLVGEVADPTQVVVHLERRDGQVRPWDAAMHRGSFGPDGTLRLQPAGTGPFVIRIFEAEGAELVENQISVPIYLEPDDGERDLVFVPFRR